LAQPAQEKTTFESRACCPIVNGTSAILRWAIARFPHTVRAALFLILAVAVGAAYNAAHPLGLPWLPSPGNRVGIPRAFETRLPQINAVQAMSLYEAGDALFVDSRDAADYAKDHIPGAVNLPMRKWAEIWPQAESQLPRDRTLVLYCYGAHCGLSTRQGKALLEEGYEDLVVLDYGWSTWTKHGQPTVRHPEGYLTDEGGA
jgi:rhodanese-related sulfurtransferase